MNNILTIEQIRSKLEKLQNRQRRYKNYPGSPGDDAIFGDMGFYTVGSERGYINKYVKKYTLVLKHMEANNLLEISLEEIFIHF